MDLRFRDTVNALIDNCFKHKVEGGFFSGKTDNYIYM